MPEVDFVVKQTKLAQDESVNIPDHIYEKGYDAVKKYLWKKGYVDDALDYAETDTELKVIMPNKTKSL